jgi:ankyrin repeat protein
MNGTIKMTDVVYKAIRRDDLETMKKCINENIIDIRWRDFRYERTLLHCSAAWSAIDCLQFLINCGANVNSTDYIGNTPLHTIAETHLGEAVCHRINVENTGRCVKALLDAGANINAVNIDDQTPFMLSIPRNINYKNDHTMRILIDRGADPALGNHKNTPKIPIHIQEFIKSRKLVRVTAIAFITLYKKAWIGGNGKDVLRLIGRHIWSMRIC